MLPIVIRSTEEILRLVPAGLREASLALGASRARTILTVVLPAAIPGITSGALLAVARAAGETAPLLFTIGAARKVNWNVFDGANTALSTQIFRNATQPFPGAVERAWGAALTLIVLVVVLTILARIVTKRFSVPIRLAPVENRQLAHIERSRGRSFVVIGRPYLPRYMKATQRSVRSPPGRNGPSPPRSTAGSWPSVDGTVSPKAAGPRCPWCCTTRPPRRLAATLLREIAVDAARAGIRRFVNESGPDEAPVRRVIRTAGFDTATVYQQGILRSSFAISWRREPPPPGSRFPSASRSGSRAPGSS